MSDLIIEDYSEKSIVLRGEKTKEMKEILVVKGGKYNSNLRCGPGWIFPKTKEKIIKDFIKNYQANDINKDLKIEKKNIEFSSFQPSPPSSPPKLKRLMKKENNTTSNVSQFINNDLKEIEKKILDLKKEFHKDMKMLFQELEIINKNINNLNLISISKKENNISTRNLKEIKKESSKEESEKESDEEIENIQNNSESDEENENHQKNLQRTLSQLSQNSEDE